MSDEHDEREHTDEPAYEAPVVEPIGSAEELAKGNEGSLSDNGPV